MVFGSEVEHLKVAKTGNDSGRVKPLAFPLGPPRSTPVIRICARCLGRPLGDRVRQRGPFGCLQRTKGPGSAGAEACALEPGAEAASACLSDGPA